MAETLSQQQVEHVAKLARLALDPAQIERFRGDLTAILHHVEKISAIDVTDVEPLAHPLPLSNRLAPDVPEPPMPREALLRNAPAVEGPFVAVPKVLGDDGGGA